MIILLKDGADPKQVESLIHDLEAERVEIHRFSDAQHSLIGLTGDTSALDADQISSQDVVESVRRIQEPYKHSDRKFHAADTVIDVGGAKIGGGHFMMIAGPCSVESREQVLSVARSVKASGAHLLRGGAFKPRTSPYTFQGLHEKGLEILGEARREVHMPIVSEIMDISHLPLFENVDVIQVGARNMQNFELLKELGTIRKPILLKRGLANTVEELLMSAEYIMAGGNESVILCERGIRTFETSTRNTVDISAIPVLHRLSHLPVIVDPSHGTGAHELVYPMALAAAAAGADGLMIEVHNDPTHALCDGKQSLTPEKFGRLAQAVRNILPCAAKELKWD